MYERILIPTDGSDVAESAVDQALGLAEAFGAEVHALYVVDIDSVNLGLGTEQVDRLRQGRFDEMEEVKARAEEATRSVADRAAERGIAVEEHVAGGRPHAVIADHAEEIGADLIVMGSHGRGGVSRAILGSVTERVLRSTEVPVQVVSHRSD
ncbi:MAG: universal stress protein [Halopenitus sp.]